jgi:hypothetical protein
MGSEVRIHAIVQSAPFSAGKWDHIDIPFAERVGQSNSDKALEMSRADHDAIFQPVYTSRFTTRGNTVYYAGQQYASIIAAREVRNVALVAQARVQYTMYRFDSGAERVFHLSSRSLSYLKAVGRRKWGQGTGTDTWVILDDRDQQVVGKLDGKITKENVSETLAARKRSRAERTAQLIIPAPHSMRLFSNNVLQTVTTASLRVELANGERDCLWMVTYPGAKLTEKQRAALSELANAFRAAEIALKD